MPDLKPNEFITTFEDQEEHDRHVANTMRDLALAAQDFRRILWDLQDSNQLPDNVMARYESISKRHDEFIDKYSEFGDYDDDDDDDNDNDDN